MSTTSNLHSLATQLLLILLTAFLCWVTPNEATLGVTAANQENEVKNPLANDPQAVKQGQAIFVLSCAYCHGINARGGGRGPDLTAGRWLHGASDAAIFRTISRGVPGTAMPPCNCQDDEAWALIAFLRSLSINTSVPVAGDREAGKKIFMGAGACSACHLVNGQGGRFGPDLSRIGASRSPRHLIESIREPDKDIPAEYETVVAVTKEGKRITGVRKNEDTFSLQLLDQKEQFHLFLKKDLKEVIHERKSLMPKYDQRALSEKDLQDLLAYLDSLRGT
jgi:putative heme-binding domain-containing protein